MKSKTPKFLLLLLATIFLFSSLALPAAAATSTSEKCQQEAAGLYSLGLLKGIDASGNLATANNLTRAEALTMIQRICNVSLAAVTMLPVKEGSEFQDVKGHWAQDTIEMFHQLGYVNGATATTFEPNRNVTGAEFSKMLLATMGYQNLTLDSAYEKAATLGLLSDFGITNTNSALSTTFKNTPLTRGYAASICAHALFVKNADGKLLTAKLVEDGIFANTAKFDGLEKIVKENADTSAVANSTFADAVNSQLSGKENYMFSPFSLKIAMAMAANGTKGQTQTEILKALGISNLDTFNNNLKKEMAVYGNAQVSKLEVANSIWQNTSFDNSAFKTSFVNVLKQYYNVEVGSVTNADICEKINGWVNTKTHEKIKEIIGEDARSNPEYQNILINAVYFKGSWQNQFKTELTKDDTFKNADATKSTSKFMNKTDYFTYGSYNGIQAIKLPYTKTDYDEANNKVLSDDGMDLNMYILLGDQQITNPEQTLKQITFSNQYVQFSLPKFKVEYNQEMSNIFKQLGVTSAFDPDKADLSEMLQNSTDKAITKILHKTYISVDENGTEAAAVTAIMVGATSAGPVEYPKPIIMKADHPFTYIIRDDASGEILFMGQINTMQP